MACLLVLLLTFSPCQFLPVGGKSKPVYWNWAIILLLPLSFLYQAHTFINSSYIKRFSSCQSCVSDFFSLGALTNTQVSNRNCDQQLPKDLEGHCHGFETRSCWVDLAVLEVTCGPGYPRACCAPPASASGALRTQVRVTTPSPMQTVKLVISNVTFKKWVSCFPAEHKLSEAK